jgi:hypothetical protein
MFPEKVSIILRNYLSTANELGVRFHLPLHVYLLTRYQEETTWQPLSF